MPDSNGRASSIAARRIVITGGDGQLGRSVAAALRPFGHEVIAEPHATLDVTDPNSVRRRVDANTQYVVHCAALTDTTRCEREPELADAVNAVGTENVARACAQSGATLIAISSNEVFDGSADAPYDEDDAPAPLNAYARSKLDGEQRALDANPNTLVVRTSWLYGEGGSTNFVEKVKAAAGAKQKLRFVTDEIATPTYTRDLADAIVAMIHLMIDGEPLSGVFHLANDGEASRYDWAGAIVESLGINPEIEAVTTADLRAAGYDGPVKPAYSVLANTRAAALRIRLRPWREALAGYMRIGVPERG
jgi:dTDP-4-dehydrorhamnose reductase